MGELFDVLALLADQGPDCLRWNKEVDNLLFWSLLLEKRKRPQGEIYFAPLFLNSAADCGGEKHFKTALNSCRNFDLTRQIVEEQPTTMTPHARKAKLSSLQGFSL